MYVDPLYVGNQMMKDFEGHHRVDVVREKDPKEKLLRLPGTNNGRRVHYTPSLSIFQRILNWVYELVHHSPTWAPVNIQWLQGDVQRAHDVFITEPHKHPESREIVYIRLSDLEKVEIQGRSIKDRETTRGHIVETDPERVAMQINLLVAKIPK